MNGRNKNEETNKWREGLLAGWEIYGMISNWREGRVDGWKTKLDGRGERSRGTINE